jgi:transposase InsO family protein
MPWKETCAMDQKVQLIGDWLSEEYSITDLSEIYGVSRPTVYKWIERYEMEGMDGLKEQSRAPGSHPNATAPEIVERIVAAKLARQRWGPKKVITRLRAQYPEERWPAASTAGEILKREGLVKERKRKRRTPPYTQPLEGCGKPNQVWSADYKGQFRMGDGRLCYPLTITDNSSRYLLECRGLSGPTFKQTQPWFEWVFREYGLPAAIRTDNGAPFASVAVGGLSKLSVWFIKLGIKPERIDPGHPEQNGRHERMHRTLKEETVDPPRHNLREQQRAFGLFKYEYNYERPHEALGQKPPASAYEPSERPYPVRAPKVEYDDGEVIRQVRHKGEIKWKGRLIYVSEALAGEPIALQQRDNYLWEVRFSFHPLGILNELTGRILSQSKGQRESVNHVPGLKC